MEQELHAPDGALIEKAQEGDQDAFGDIFEHYVTTIYRYAYFCIGDFQLAEKVTEEIFLKIWKDIKKYRPGAKITFPMWFYQSAHRVVMNVLERVEKTRETRRRKEEVVSHLSGEQVPTEGEGERADLQSAIMELPIAQSQAIILKYFCNLSTAETGFILEKTEGAVRILQSRGLKRLREIIDEAETDE